MTTQDSTQALFNTGVSAIAATAALAKIQPFITFVSVIIACVSGVMAIRYYYVTTKKFIKDESNDEIPK